MKDIVRPLFSTIFGSVDSVDRDVVYFVPALPDFQDCKAFCRNQGDENRNLAVLEDGLVVDCFKGLPDELNNAIYRTHGLHTQTTPNPIRKAVRRIVPLKAVRAVRVVLSLLSRTVYRSEIKSALNSLNQEERVDVLGRIDFTKLELDADALKSIAFQMGQFLALVDGVECYTKTEIASAFPELEPFLTRRDHVDMSVLGRLAEMIHDAVSDVYVRQKGDLNLFCYMNSVVIGHWNQYARQTRGLVIDMKRERCVYYPGDKFWRIGEVEETRPENLPVLDEVEIVEKVDGSMVGAFRNATDFEFICKGNFDVEQSIRAGVIARRYPGFQDLDFERYWHVFEVIYPENRFPTGLCVTDYGDEEKIVLIAMRDRLDNEPLSYERVIAEARRVGLPHPLPFEGTFEDLEREIASETPHFPEKEGYVVRTKTGMLLKVKYPKYLEIHKWNNRMGQGRNRFLKNYVLLSEPQQRELMELLPDVFREHAQEEIARYEQIQAELTAAIEAYVRKYGDSFPEYAQQNAPSEYLGPILACWKKKPITAYLPKQALKIFYGQKPMPDLT